MCLITEQKEPIILEEDLIVYKNVKLTKNGYESYFFPFTWKAKKLEETELKTGIKFTGFDPLVTCHYKDSISEIKSWEEGFHFAFTKERLHILNVPIKEFLIPKGAQVVKDATGLGVTNKIMML